MKGASNEDPYVTIFEGNVTWSGPLKGNMIEIKKTEQEPVPEPRGGVPVGGNPAFR